MVRANRRARINSAAGLTDEQIKARNDQAHAAFMAARSAARRGFDQSGTKIRTSEGEDGKARTSITGSGKKDTRNAAAARSSARAAGVLETPKKKKKKPFRAGTISRESGMLNVDPYSTQANAARKPKAKKQKVKPKSAIKSLDTLQGTFQGMLTILKLNRAPHKTSRKLTTEGEHSGKGVKGGNTQFEGTQIMERNRGDRTVIRDPTGKPKERKAGRLNYQTTTGGASTLKATTCRLWKAELNDTFNTLLDNFQHLYKDYETDKFNEAEGKSKKKPITNTGRSGKGSLGGDTQSTPPAMGTTRSDQQVMQS
jgi:hypothetical protein